MEKNDISVITGYLTRWYMEQGDLGPTLEFRVVEVDAESSHLHFSHVGDRRVKVIIESISDDSN